MVRALWLIALSACSGRPLKDEPNTPAGDPLGAAAVPIDGGALGISSDAVRACSATAKCIAAESRAPYVYWPDWSACESQVNGGAGDDALQKAVACAYSYCLGADSNAPRRCQVLYTPHNAWPNTDGFPDAPDVSEGSCQQCVFNAAARLLGVPCGDPSDPACFNDYCSAADR